MKNQRSFVRDILAGAVAGLAATWVMDRVTTLAYEREDPRKRRQEDKARGGKTAYDIAATKAGALVGQKLSERQLATLGKGLHWGIGVGAGAAYGVLRHRMRASRWGSGVAFGTAFWATIDEGANTLLGLTPAPNAFPLQTHARGLAGHIAFGLTADATLRLSDKLLG
jgi:hypothetical protein